MWTGMGKMAWGEEAVPEPREDQMPEVATRCPLAPRSAMGARPEEQGQGSSRNYAGCPHLQEMTAGHTGASAGTPLGFGCGHIKHIQELLRWIFKIKLNMHTWGPDLFGLLDLHPLEKAL